MTIARHIEVSAQSDTSLQDAIEKAIREASQTLRGISQYWVQDIMVNVENNKITCWKVNGKMSFVLDDRGQ
jgi:dodecin